MSSQVPPFLWFLFWVGLAIGVLSFGFFMAIIIHRGNMKALEVLRTYAEKGIEPPPAVVEMLTRQMGDTDASRAGREIGKKAGGELHRTTGRRLRGRRHCLVAHGRRRPAMGGLLVRH